jgi:hypothetical protein
MQADPGETEGVPSDNTTLSAVLERYEAAGYTVQFVIEAGGTLVCGNCGASVPAAEANVRSRRRLEGASDPADMAVIHAVTCTTCGRDGTVVSRYGPEADEDEIAFLLAARRPEGDERIASDADPGDASAS